MTGPPLPELPVAIVDGLESWGRTLNAATTYKTALDILYEAAADVFRAEKAGRAAYPDSDGAIHQAIMESLDGMAAAVGIDADDARSTIEQAQRGKPAPKAGNGLDRAIEDTVIVNLAGLSPFEYQKRRKAEAKSLGVTAAALDEEVKRRRPKKAERDFNPHWSVEPWPEPVDGDALLDEIRCHFRRYVVLPEQADIALALWVLHTWVFQCFDITPYLCISSPTPRCGKTVLMTMLYWLCCRAKKTDSMSKAAIYRSVDSDKPTLVLDEVNWILDLTDERANIINGGFERNGCAETCEGEGADIKTRQWSTYCPKAFGLIGRLTPTLMDRSIEITMRRKTAAESAERLRRRDNEDHATLRRKCKRWAQDNAAPLAMAPEIVAPGLNDRAVDCWEPLLIIAKQAGGEWPDRAMKAAEILSGEERAAEQMGVELLADCWSAFRSAGLPAITTKTLGATYLCADAERPWATWNKGKAISDRQIAGLLKPFHIISETVHPNETGEKDKAKGYRLMRFEDAFRRYLPSANASSPEDGDAQACERASTDGTGTTDTFRRRAETDLHGCEKREKPASHAGLHARTLRNPPVAGVSQFGRVRDLIHTASESDFEVPPIDTGSLPPDYSESIAPESAPPAPPPASPRAQVEPAKTDDLTIPAFLDRRAELVGSKPEPEFRPGALLTDDDEAFLDSGGFK
jgi:hypothetical protein